MKTGSLLSVSWHRGLFALCVMFFHLMILVSCAAPAAMEMPGEAAAPPPQEAQDTAAPEFPATVQAPTMTVEAAQPTPEEVIHQENRMIEIEWPAMMRVGDSDVIRLSLVMDELGTITPTAVIEGHSVTGEAVQIPNLYDTHNLVAEARLDLLGIESLPQGTISEPMSPGKNVNFYWNIQSHNPGIYRGTLWLHVNLVPKDNIGQIEKMALLAMPIEIETTTILGMSSKMARIFSFSGSLFSTIIGFPFLESILKFFWQKIHKK